MIKDAPGFINFIKKAFDAKEVFRTDAPDGSLMHAEIKIGDSMVMLTEASEKYPATQSYYYLYVPDTDASYKQALEAGATFRNGTCRSVLRRQECWREGSFRNYMVDWNAYRRCFLLKR